MTAEQRDLLQALAFLYLRHGQNRRALTLALLASRDAPHDVGIMRLLAYAFVANDAPEEALEVIEQLERMDFAAGAERMRCLLKARALLHAGRRVEARAVFRQFVEARRTDTGPLDGVGLGQVVDGPEGFNSAFPEPEALIASGRNPFLSDEPRGGEVTAK